MGGAFMETKKIYTGRGTLLKVIIAGKVYKIYGIKLENK